MQRRVNGGNCAFVCDFFFLSVSVSTRHSNQHTKRRMTSVFDPERVSRIAEISTKFHSHAQVGDEIVLGIQGDDQMPARYRNGDTRPMGVITNIRNAGRPDSVLTVKLESGPQVKLLPYQLGGDRIWEFSERSWPQVFKRSQQKSRHSEPEYRANSAVDGSEIEALRNQIEAMQTAYQRNSAEHNDFKNAMIDAISQLTSDIARASPDNAHFSNVFNSEFRSAKSSMVEPFDSDYESD